MKRKFSFWLIGAMLIATLFTACSKADAGSVDTGSVDTGKVDVGKEDNKVTPQSLIENAFPEDMEFVSYDIIVVMDLEAIYDNVSMVMKANGTFSAEATKKATYMSGETEVEVLGMKMTEPTKSYTVIEDGKKYEYEYDADLEEWIYTVSDTTETTLLDSFKFESLEGLELTEQDGKYVVTGDIDYDDLPFSDMDDTTDEGMEDVLKQAGFCITFIFNSNKEIESCDFTCNLDAESQKGQEVIVNEMSFEIVFESFNGDADAVKVPNSVKENAILKDDLDIDLDDGDLDDNGIKDAWENADIVTEKETLNFVVPAGFEKLEVGNNSFCTKGGAASNIIVNTTVKDGTLDTITGSAMLQEVEKSLESAYGSDFTLTLLDEEYFLVDGHKAFMHSYSYKLGEDDIIQTQYIFENGDVYEFITFTDFNEGYTSAFAECASSIEYK